MDRVDETWHRLIQWTSGQAPSERLAVQILLHLGYQEVDPSHPLGGPDGAKDAACVKDGQKWIMASYFPRGQQKFRTIKGKFLTDLPGVSKNFAEGIAFVTNQELTLAQREELIEVALPTKVELIHLERLTSILDSPDMAPIRKQFLLIETTESADRELLKFYSGCFEREVFRVRFRAEGSMFDFDTAIGNVITALCSGGQLDRETGTRLNHAKGFRALENLDWQARMQEIVHLLRALRTEFKAAVDAEDIVITPRENDDPWYYVRWQSGLAERMDARRAEILAKFSELCVEARLSGFEFPS